ncbi:MAG: HlyD family efflux transporter periplasmic adaptor subunit, partial [Bacteroidota bacterium]
MLNISTNTIKDKLDITTMSSYGHSTLPKANRMLAAWLVSLLVVTIIVFFLPWTQNVQMKGRVTTLLPEQRPQDINAMIAGRIEKWYVREGDLVGVGDTIAWLSEVKAEYFDPMLVERTGNQVQAKEGSIQSYQLKADALAEQISALEKEREQKKEQLENKIVQARLKQQSQQAALQQAEVDYDIAAFQMRRTDTLYQKGIKSLSDLEGKRLKMQEARAKLVSAQNKLGESGNELNIAQSQLDNIDNEYANKIAKARSDRFSTLSARYEAEGTLNKLRSQYANYDRRNNFYYIIAPQAGYITKAVKSGIGEIVKDGETVVTIVPLHRELAVEMYVRPMDLPLMNPGNEVRLIFDGWQAFIISGWSDFSFGTYKG